MSNFISVRPYLNKKSHQSFLVASSLMSNSYRTYLAASKFLFTSAQLITLKNASM